MSETYANFDDLLRAAIAADDCTQIRCTTCGATNFRTRIFRFLHADTQAATKGRTVLQLSEADAETLLVAMRDVPFEHFGDRRASSALQLTLYLIWNALGRDASLPQMRAVLGSGFAGRILKSMEAHSSALAARRTDHFARNAPEHRARRLAERAERHAERLRLKRVRDVKWHMKHAGLQALDHEKPESS